MAGLVPAIHVVGREGNLRRLSQRRRVDDRDKLGHDVGTGKQLPYFVIHRIHRRPSVAHVLAPSDLISLLRSTELSPRPQAVPLVSNTAKSIASRALRPAHRTNWNAWK
jgi:hypothetical protein